MKIEDLFETRLKKGVTYDEKKVKGILNRVTAILSGKKEKELGEIGRYYEKLSRLIEKLSEKKKKLNSQITEQITGLFDAEDAAVTRVVKTAKVDLTLAKLTSSEIEHVDYHAILEELWGMREDLHEVLTELKGKYTTLETVSKKPGLRVKKISESQDDLLNKIRRFALLTKNKIMSKLSGYDDQLENIKSQLGI